MRFCGRGVALVSFSTAAMAATTSSGRKDQARGEATMPICSHRIGTLAIVPPDKEWWRELNLGSPEAIIKVFVQQSGCFTLVNRDRAMNSRAMERAMADNGELQRGSNMGKGQVKAADYFLQPDIVSTNKNSGGGGAGAAIGGLLGHFGGWAARSERSPAGSTSRRARPTSLCRWSTRAPPKRKR